MDVLLISPPREVPQRPDFPPIGLAYLCSMLKKAGLSAKVLDASAFSWSRLAANIREISPFIIGITCFTVERHQSLRCARLVREILPDAKIVFGGHHATAFPEHLFVQAYADVVVLGEGECTIVDVSRVFLDGGNLSQVNGIVYREGNNIIKTAPRELIDDLDSIPYPSYSDFKLDNYIGLPETGGRATCLMSSRGCPYRCAFCSGARFWKHTWRARSADNVLGEVQWLYDTYNVRNFVFYDDNFTVRNDRVIEICKGILDRGLEIKWTASSHVTHIREEMLFWMKKAGCFRIDFGVESGSARILKSVKKGQTPEHIRNAFRLVHNSGIKPKAYLMVGNPGEDEQTIDETIRLMYEIKPYFCDTGGILWVLPDTEIYEIAKQQGVINDEFWLHNEGVIYYNGERTVKKLKVLRNRLMKGMA
ncbi:MAG: B12-binding domain-containing radical SAM protein, partial [Candidatus Omnitrophica bacterium]|nr:B12-binding domain-containing radical SAM protein [Candidatus Omnitrophota bacterium]